MLDKYFIKEVISQMTFDEFEKTYRGSAVFVKHRVSIEDAFKQLGGKIEKSSKIEKSDKIEKSSKATKPKKYKKVDKSRTEEGI